MKIVVEFILPGRDIRHESEQDVRNTEVDLALAFDGVLAHGDWGPVFDFQAEDGVRVFAVPDHIESVADRLEATA